MFDPTVVLQIDIELGSEDWDALRIQGRSVTDLVGPNCLAEPLFRIYDYFSATVTVDGVALANVGVRKKGLIGSLSPTKPSLKVKFDEYVPNQELSGLSRLTLNNARSDPSYVRQCLGYQMFAAAGLPSPRCNFANVTVNGENLGLFTNIEGIKKPFIRRHFSDDDGNLYEGTLSDFRSDLHQTFEKKTNKSRPDRSDVLGLVTIAENATDSALLAELGTVMDVDQYMTFWAMEMLVGHGDGYASNTNNFYVYGDPTSGVFHFIPWGIDSIFRGGGIPSTGAVATGMVPRRLAMYQPTLDMYAARATELLGSVWKESELLAEIDRMEALIRPYVLPSEKGFDDALTEVRDFISQRRAIFEPALAAPQLWTAPLRPVPCLDVYGVLTATFTTTWDSFDQDPLVAGSGSVSGTFLGSALQIVDVGAVSGFGGQAGIEASVGILATQADGTALVVLIETPAPQFLPGTTINLDYAGSFAPVFRIDMGMVEPIGLMANGTVSFSAATTSDGAPVSGTISGTIYDTFPNL